MSRIFASRIQSDFREGGHGKLEAVVHTGGELRHWFRWNPHSDAGWRRSTVTTRAASFCTLPRGDRGHGGRLGFSTRWKGMENSCTYPGSTTKSTTYRMTCSARANSGTMCPAPNTVRTR